MSVYEYQAIAKATGRTVKGVIDADSPAAARRKLRDLQLYPTDVQESFVKEKSGAAVETGGRGRGRVKLRDVAMMTRQLAVLLHAGMPLVESLGALLDQTSSARLKKIIYDVRAKVNEGARLGTAMS